MNCFRQFFYNLRFFLFSRKAHKRFVALQDSIQALNYEFSLLSNQHSEDEDLQLALDYLRKRPLCMDQFPYEKQRDMGEIVLRYDKGEKLNYVIHKGHPLYFPKDMTEDIIREAYRFAIEDDDIIGDGYRQRSPHAYQSERYHIGEGDILIDAGSAEGLFALDVIEKVSKVYIIECDPRWRKPLEATFRPWKDKVEIVRAILSGEKHGDEIGLVDLLNECGTHDVFVKMDIEGAEVEVLKGARAYLSARKTPIIFAVCAYHRTTDYDTLMDFFNSINYNTETQPGYMYTKMNDGRGIYTFRKVMIRASNT